MELDIYQRNLAGLLLVCGTLFAARGADTAGKSLAAGDGEKKLVRRQYAHHCSQWSFYLVYSLVMAADWLQGPFLYSLYRDEHGVSAEVVSTLFTTGFLSGAVSGYFIGSLADRSGRRLTCLFFCAAYAASCVLTMIPSVPLLYAGRVLGGVSTSLLFSVFESWMVTDFHVRRLEKKGMNISRTFGTMSTLNSLAAIVSGVFSEWIVKATGTKKSPFAVSIALLGMAAGFIYLQWDENYGGVDTKSSKTDGPAESKLFKALTNVRVLSLGLASTVFEGSMYLFVFFWTPAIQAAKQSSGDLPYGTIFASFMASMMAASLVFNIVMAGKPPVSYGGLLVGIMVLANLCFFSFAKPRPEQQTFWLYCLFEACVGMYWPCMGYLKGKLVDDAVRAQVYGILRIPLNIFVVVSLTVTGDGTQYGKVFSVCSSLLMASSAALFLTMVGRGAP